LRTTKVTNGPNPRSCVVSGCAGIKGLRLRVAAQGYQNAPAAPRAASPGADEVAASARHRGRSEATSAFSGKASRNGR